MRFAYGHAHEFYHQTLTETSLDRSDADEPLIRSSSLDLRSSVLAILFANKIWFFDSAKERTFLCERVKPLKQAKYRQAKWKPDRTYSNNNAADLNSNDRELADEYDQSTCLEFRRRYLTVLNESNCLLVFAVAVGTRNERNAGQRGQSANVGAEEMYGNEAWVGARSASCVLKRAIKVRFIDDDDDRESAESRARAFEFSRDGSSVFIGTSKGGVAIARLFTNEGELVDTDVNGLELKEYVFGSDVRAALAPRHRRRKTKGVGSNSSSKKDSKSSTTISRMMMFTNEVEDEDEDEYYDEDDEDDGNYDNGYDDDDDNCEKVAINENENGRTKGRKTDRTNASNQKATSATPSYGGGEEYDPITSLQVTPSYLEKTSCVVSFSSGRCAVIAFSSSFLEADVTPTTFQNLPEIVAWLGDGDCSVIAAHGAYGTQRIAVGTRQGDVDIFSIVTRRKKSSDEQKRRIRFERRFSAPERDDESGEVCALAWTKSGDALAVANRDSQMSLNVWSRVGTRLYAYESNFSEPKKTTTTFNGRCLCWNGSASCFYSDFSLFDISLAEEEDGKSKFREIKFVIAPPDSNVRVHPRNAPGQKYSLKDEMQSTTKPSSGVLLGSDRIVIIDDDDSDESDNDEYNNSSRHYRAGEDIRSEKGDDSAEENRYDSDADFYNSSSSSDVEERFKNNIGNITTTTSTEEVNKLRKKSEERKKREHQENMKRKKEKRERDARISPKPPKPLRCRHELLPSEYISSRFPARKIATSPDGLDIAVAGSRGFVTYSLSRNKWRLFRDVSKEKKIRVTKMAWLTLHDAFGDNNEKEKSFNALAVACYRTDDVTKHELRVYAAATQPLDEQCEIVKAHSLGSVAPVALDACGSHILVISPPCEIALFEVRLTGNFASESLSSSGGSFFNLFGGSSFSNNDNNNNFRKSTNMPIKAELRVARDVSGRRRVASGDPTLAPPIAAALWVANYAFESPRAMPAPSMCALLRPCGTLSVLKLSGQNAGKEVRIKAPQKSASERTSIIERFWLAARATVDGNGVMPEADNAWWTFGENGLEVHHEDFEDLFISSKEETSPANDDEDKDKGDNDDDDDDDDDDAISNDADAYEFDEEFKDSFPISINLEQFRAVCASRQTHQEHSFGASGGRLDVASVQKSILPLLLKNSLAKRDVGAARILARQARKRSRRLFSYALEWLIYDALEECTSTQVTNKMDSHSYRSSLDLDNVVVGPASAINGEGGDKRELLTRSINLAREFEEFPDVVVAVARKTDQDLWPELFKACGVKASTLLKAACDRGRLRVASRGLVVSCFMDGEEAGRELAYDILDSAFELKDFHLIGEVVRFLSVGFDMLDRIDNKKNNGSSYNDEEDDDEEEEASGGGGFFSMFFGSTFLTKKKESIISRHNNKEEILMLRRERLILEKALEHKLDEIIFDVDARSLGAFYRHVPIEAFDVYAYFVRESNGKCSFEDFDDENYRGKGSLSTPTTSPRSSSSPYYLSSRNKQKSKALGFSGALKRAVDTALSQKRLGGNNNTTIYSSSSPQSSSSMLLFENDYSYNNNNIINQTTSDERYALEVVKRAKNLEWTLVLATLARDKKTLLELIDFKESDAMYIAWRASVESCIDEKITSSSFEEEEEEEEERESYEALTSYKRAFFAQLLADMHTEEKKEKRQRTKSSLNPLVIPEPYL